MVKRRPQRIVFQPGAGQGLQRGIKTMVAAVRPTLGPLPRFVALETSTRTQSPELLDDAATIARRILELPDRDGDMGAMLVRNLLWRMHEQAGDGAATAAVLLQAVYDEGLKYVAAGGNAMLLRRYLEEGLRLVIGELAGMAVPLEGQDRLTSFAHSVCQDFPLSQMMGEIFDIIGEYGRLDIRAGRSRELEREYVEGMYWDSTPHSREMVVRDQKVRADLEDAAVLISDISIEDAQQLVPILDEVTQAGVHGLLIIASKISAGAMALLLANSDPDRLRTVAVRTPTGPAREGALQDLALLTGGRPILHAAGQTLAGIRFQDLGRARRAWADATHFGIVGGRGDPRLLRQHIAHLRAAYAHAKTAETRRELRERIGKLIGGSATLWTAGVTESEIKARKTLAERTAEAMRGAMLEGVVPGGGVALLACRVRLQQELSQADGNPERRAAYHILIRALAEPARTIVANAGCDVAAVMGEIERAGPGYGFDVRSEQITNLAEAGVLDAARVVRLAVAGAVSGAALALTTDVLVHRKNPPQAVTP